MHPETVQIAELIQEAWRGQVAAAEGKHVQLRALMDPGTTVCVDRDLAVTALGDVLADAVLLTEDGTLIDVFVYRGPAAVAVDVLDQCGGGARARRRPRLERAQRAARALGGAASVRNLERRGCRVRLELPT